MSDKRLAAIDRLLDQSDHFRNTETDDARLRRRAEETVSIWTDAQVDEYLARSTLMQEKGNLPAQPHLSK